MSFRDSSTDTTSQSGGRSTDTTPTTATPSAYLQDLIADRREKRNVSRRLSISGAELRSSSIGPDEREGYSSPLTPSVEIGGNMKLKGRNRNASEIGSRAPSLAGTMGAREQENKLAKLDKENFALKLDMFKFRQKNEQLEKRNQELEILAQEAQETQGINDALILELEKRDKAIQEAVDMICILESQLMDVKEESKDAAETLARNGRDKYPESREVDALESTVEGNDNYGKDDDHDSDGTADEYNRDLISSGLSRQPRFLREQDSGTSALRSLYSADGDSFGAMGFARFHRPLSMMSRDDRTDTFTLASPSLSNLSESSFTSVYGKSKDDMIFPERPPPWNLGTKDLKDESTAAFVQDQRSRAKPRPLSTSTICPGDIPNPQRKPSHRQATDRIASIGQVLQSTPPRPERQASSKPKHSRHVTSPDLPKREAEQPQSKIVEHQASFAGPMFNREGLPPTPDTLYPDKAGSLNSSRSIIAEKSQNDNGSFSRLQQCMPHQMPPHRGRVYLRPTSDSDSSEYEGDTHDIQTTTVKDYAPPSENTPLNDTMSKARRLMGLHAHGCPDSSPFGSNMMFDGNESFPSSFSASRYKSSDRLSTSSGEVSRKRDSRTLPEEWTHAAAQPPQAQHSDEALNGLTKRVSPRKLRNANNLANATDSISANEPVTPSTAPLPPPHRVSPLVLSGSPAPKILRSSSVASPRSITALPQKPHSPLFLTTTQSTSTSATSSNPVTPVTSAEPPAVITPTRQTLAARIFRRQGSVPAKISSPQPPISATGSVPSRAHPDADSSLVNANQQGTPTNATGAKKVPGASFRPAASRPNLAQSSPMESPMIVSPAMGAGSFGFPLRLGRRVNTVPTQPPQSTSEAAPSPVVHTEASKRRPRRPSPKRRPSSMIESPKGKVGSDKNAKIDKNDVELWLKISGQQQGSERVKDDVVVDDGDWEDEAEAAAEAGVATGGGKKKWGFMKRRASSKGARMGRRQS